MEEYPSSPEIERQVLGAMLLNKKACIIGITSLTKDVFFHWKNRALFQAAVDLVNSGSPVDIISISEAAKKYVDKESLDVDYVTDVFTSIGTSTNVEYHCKILNDFYIRRRLIQIGESLTKKSVDNTVDINEVAGEVSNAVIEIVRSHGKGRIISTLSELARDNIERIEATGNDRPVIPTGFPFPTCSKEFALDTYLGGGGLGVGELHIIGALESAGKSSLATLLAYTASMIGKEKGYGVAYYSLEGGESAVIRTLRTQLSGVSMDDESISNHKAYVVDTLKEIEESKLPFVVDDMRYDRPVTTAKLAAHVKMAKSEYNSKLFIIDYLTQLSYRAEHYTADLERILADLVDIAGAEQVAILCLHHLSSKYADELRLKNEPLDPEISHFGMSPAGIRRYSNTILAISNPHSAGTIPTNKIDSNGIDWGSRSGMPKRVELRCLKNKTGSRDWKLPLEWHPKAVLFTEWKQSVGKSWVNDAYN